MAFHPTEVRGIIEQHSKIEIVSKEFSKCPKCGKISKSQKDIEKEFGFRNIKGITKPQSWCRKCR